MSRSHLAYHEAIGSIERGSGELAEELGGLAERAHRELERLGLSTPELEDLLEAGARAGAVGGKLSGAGGGGAFYLVARTSEAAHQVSRAVRARARELGLDTAGTVRSFRWPPREEQP